MRLIVPPIMPTDRADWAANACKRPICSIICERDDSAAELELMAAMREYERETGRMSPSWSEVVGGLGYRKDG
jgi:hypothetical protein